MGTNSFVTGGTGLIGRHLIERLLDAGHRVTALVRPNNRERHQPLLSRLERHASGTTGTLTFVEGDLATADLGLADPSALRDATHVFHLAALYDLDASPEALSAANVEGTRRLLTALHQAKFGGILQHFSTLAVAGEHAGDFSETDFDLDQQHAHPYERTKFESEKLVRESGLRYRIYRPGGVVGHSKTGEMDRIDGVYHVFKLVDRVRRVLPTWFPLVGFTDAPLPVAPVDFVAAAAAALSAAPDGDGQTYHLTDPAPKTFRETWNLISNAAAGPTIRRTVGGKLAKFAPLVTPLGSVKFLRKELLEELDIPASLLTVRNRQITYRSEATHARLKELGVHCPDQGEYLPVLWDYWARNLDPDLRPDRRERAFFAGKIVLITGASSGVGAALARHVAKHGAHVIAVARSEDKLTALVREIESDGGKAEFMVADLSELEDCDRVVATVKGAHPHLDVLVNNAGRSIRRPTAESLERFHDFERVMKLNFFGPIRLIRGFLPDMLERGGGHVVNVLSAGVLLPTPRFAAYMSSKAALHSLSDTLAAEYYAQGLRVTNAQLPLVKTPMMQASGAYEDNRVMTPDKAAAWISDAIVKRRRWLLTGDTKRRFLYNVLMPKGMTRAINLLSRIYGETVPPELAADRKFLRRFVKGNPM